jgi:hypothetical protein
MQRICIEVVGRPDLHFLGSVGVKHTDSLRSARACAPPEEIDRGKWVVQWRLNIPWTTPLPVSASLLATSRAHRSRPKRLRH